MELYQTSELLSRGVELESQSLVHGLSKAIISKRILFGRCRKEVLDLVVGSCKATLSIKVCRLEILIRVDPAGNTLIRIGISFGKFLL
jgi:hypothetical protein